MNKQYDILGDFEEDLIDRSWISKALLVQLFTFILLIVFYYLSDLLPENLYQDKAEQLRTYGFIVLFLFIANSLITPKVISRARPKRTTFFTLLFCAGSIFLLTLFYKVFDYIVHRDLLQIDVRRVLLSALSLAFVFGMISNIRIHVIKRKGVWVSIILFIVSLLTIFYVLGAYKD